MSNLIDFLITRVWWTFDPTEDWYSQPYHWINLIEGCAWLVFSALVSHRYLKNRNSKAELAYALSFLTFALSDFREAYVVESWLILFKGANLVAILLLRRFIIRRYYPRSRTY